MSKTYNAGDEVMLEGEVTAEVVSYSKGWYTLDGDRKVRAKQILGLVEQEDSEEMSLSETMQKYRKKYIKAKGYNGLPTINNGDDLATLLLPLDPQEVVELAEKALGFEKDELYERYSNLNPGMRRMVCGNRLRAALKKGTITTDDVEQAIG